MAGDTSLLRDLLIGIIAAAFVARLYVDTYLVEHDFAAKPYINAAIYAVVLALVLLRLPGARAPAATSRYWLWLSVIGLVYLISLSLGLYYRNSFAYMIAWSTYVVSGLIMAFVVSGSDRATFEEMISRAVTSDVLLWLIVLINFASAILLDNYYIVWDWVSVSLLFTRLAVQGGTRNNLVLLASILLPHFFEDAALSITLSRSLIGMLVAIFLIYYAFLRRGIRIVLVVAAVGVMLLYLTNMDDRDLAVLPRNVTEGVLLLKGDALENHISTQQRFYEIDTVQGDLATNAPWSYITGMGLGRTLDMSLSRDNSVKSTSLLGETEVNTIHFLPYALLHKFGLLGLGLLALMVGALGLRFFSIVAAGTQTPSQLFGYLYVLGNLAFAFSGSNHMLAEPIWPFLVAGLLRGYYKPGGAHQPLTHAARPGADPPLATLPARTQR